MFCIPSKDISCFSALAQIARPTFYLKRQEFSSCLPMLIYHLNFSVDTDIGFRFRTESPPNSIEPIFHCITDKPDAIKLLKL